MAIRLDHGDDDGLDENHEINVTPFIDVILVLLIIFMVAAPLATVDVAVDLPASTAEPQPRPDKPIFLTVKADLQPRARRRHRCRATALATRSIARPVATRSSASSCAPTRPCPTARLMSVMNLLRTAGYLKIALVGLDAEQAP